MLREKCQSHPQILLRWMSVRHKHSSPFFSVYVSGKCSVQYLHFVICFWKMVTVIYDHLLGHKLFYIYSIIKKSLPDSPLLNMYNSVSSAMYRALGDSLPLCPLGTPHPTKRSDHTRTVRPTETQSRSFTLHWVEVGDQEGGVSSKRESRKWTLAQRLTRSCRLDWSVGHGDEILDFREEHIEEGVNPSSEEWWYHTVFSAWKLAQGVWFCIRTDDLKPTNPLRRWDFL